MMMSADTNTIVIIETHSYTQFYMFAYRWDGSEWNLIGNILNVNPGNAFMQAVSISGDGNTIVASGLNPYETGGEAFAYRLIDNVWTKIGGNTLNRSGNNSYTRYGSANAMSYDGTVIAIFWIQVKQFRIRGFNCT